MNYCKLDEPELVNQLSQFDIIGLAETHCLPEETPYLEGYKTFVMNRPLKESARKPSGGIAAFVKSKLSKGITLNERSGQHAIWLRLKKDYFGIDKDIFVGIVYLLPENSPYATPNSMPVIELLEEDIQKLSLSGNIMLLGDLNARTGTESDFIPYDSPNYIPSINELPYIGDGFPPARANQDGVLNDRGKDLLELCVSVRIRILNGRFPGDSMGYFTCHKHNGSSAVDYGMVSEEILSNILYFHVHRQLSSFTDHCQIALCLHKLKFKKSANETVSLKPLPRSFKWNEDSAETFLASLCMPDSVTDVNHIMQTTFNETVGGVEQAVSKLETVMIRAAERSLKSKRIKQKRRDDHKKWFNGDLARLRREVTSAGRLMCCFPRDPFIRGNYFRTLKIYRKSCKLEYQKFKSKLISQLDSLHNSNPREYWNLVGQISGSTEKKGILMPDSSLSITKN